MKVAFNENDNKKVTEVPILPLVPIVKRYTKEQCITFKLRTDPTNDKSPIFELSLPILSGTESVREVIQWRLNIIKVVIGMNATTAVERQEIAERCLTTTALQAFKAGWKKAVKAVDDAAKIAAYRTWKTNYDNCADDAARTTLGPFQAPAPVAPANLDPTDILASALGDLVIYMTPHKALPKIKRFLRRNCRKPHDMRIREFWNHLQRINEEELPQLPPAFDNTQSLANDELIDIILFAFPKSWSNEMERQGFDPNEKTVDEVLAFCERLEGLEKDSASSTKKSNNNNGSSSKKPYKGQSNGDNHCMLHGKGNHDTNGCKVLQAQAKRLKASGNDSGGYQKRSGNYQNKSWNRKANDSNDKSKKELAAFMKKTIREELNAMSANKRKSDDSDNEDNESLNALEKVDLSGFNYSAMDDLKIDSDDDTVSESGSFHSAKSKTE